MFEIEKVIYKKPLFLNTQPAVHALNMCLNIGNPLNGQIWELQFDKNNILTTGVTRVLVANKNLIVEFGGESLSGADLDNRIKYLRSHNWYIDPEK
jgi:hypothetical protein